MLAIIFYSVIYKELLSIVSVARCSTCSEESARRVYRRVKYYMLSQCINIEIKGKEIIIESS